MGTQYRVNLWPMLEKIAVKAITETLSELYIESIKKSPVRTWTFVSQHRNLWIRKEWNTYIWEIVNEWDYSEKVEMWWRSRPVNWHLKDWSIYYSKGADVYKNALNKVKNNFLKRLWQ